MPKPPCVSRKARKNDGRQQTRSRSVVVAFNGAGGVRQLTLAPINGKTCLRTLTTPRWLLVGFRMTCIFLRFSALPVTQTATGRPKGDRSRKTTRGTFCCPSRSLSQETNMTRRYPHSERNASSERIVSPPRFLCTQRPKTGLLGTSLQPRRS